MGWLDDQTHTYRYACSEGHVSFFEMSEKDQDYESPGKCLTCDKEAAYAGFEPKDIHLVGKVAYDQHGRKAYRISDGKGKVTHISKTKYDYLQTGKIEGKYTTEYEAKLREDEVANEYLLTTDHHRRMASVKHAIGLFGTQEEGASE